MRTAQNGSHIQLIAVLILFFTLLTTPRKAEERSDINERCASPVCQRPRRCCCCLFSAMNSERHFKTVYVITSFFQMVVTCWCCQLLQHENTTVDSTEKNLQFRRSLAHCRSCSLYTRSLDSAFFGPTKTEH